MGKWGAKNQYLSGYVIFGQSQNIKLFIESSKLGKYKMQVFLSDTKTILTIVFECKTENILYFFFNKFVKCRVVNHFACDNNYFMLFK